MIEIEVGATGTTAKVSKTYKSGRKVYCLVDIDRNIDSDGLQAIKAEFSEDWKGSLKKYNTVTESE